MSTTPETIFLKDYQAPAYLVDSVELTFHLAPSATRVISKIKFYPNPATSDRTFRLDGAGLTLVHAKIDGKDVAPTPVTEGILCDAPDAPFVWEAEVIIDPHANTALEGLYMSNGMYCTQCEPQGFRKITYYPDRPDVLAPFHVRIEGSHPILLSNGNPVGQGDGWAEWDDPWPKPAYLFALVAGDLIAHSDRFATKSGRDVALNIWVRDGDQDKCEYAMHALKASMTWDETVYGREYDLDVFNIVAVDDFNLGAMENKGLNIFNSTYVLAHPDITTDDGFELVESIIAHEYFHNWTGNRITCRDWFQLCLKEGLTVFRDTQFTADMRSAPVKRINDVCILRDRQFREDNSPLAHPVRPESFVEINNFYTLTVYEKGSALISMLKGLVGDDLYYKSLEEYFNRHDGQAVTIEDWINVFQDVTGRDLQQFMLWYRQAGTPRVRIDEEFKDGTLTLHIQQSIPDTPNQTNKAPHVIPIAVGLLAPDGAEVMETTVLELTQAHQSFSFSGFETRPIPSVLRNFSAPVILEGQRDLDRLAFLLAHDTDPFARWDAGQEIMRDVLTTMILHNADCDPRLIAGLCNGVRDDGLDPAFRAYLITPPTEEALAQHIKDMGHDVDPMVIHGAITRFKRAFVASLGDDLTQIYDALVVHSAYQPDAEQSARRSLRAKLLMLMTLRDGPHRAQAEFDHADNMTDTLAALSALISVGAADNALAQFEKRWGHERLAMDRWFSTQVTHAAPDALTSVVEGLIAHPQFSLANPNRARSVLVSMGRNFAGFHNLEGAAYRILADHIITIDPTNPQLAARISNGLSSWQLMPSAHQTAILSEIDRVLAQPNLSRDTKEMLSRIRG
jgi:aminopeptidase N